MVIYWKDGKKALYEKIKQVFLLGQLQNQKIHVQRETKISAMKCQNLAHTTISQKQTQPQG